MPFQHLEKYHVLDLAHTLKIGNIIEALTISCNVNADYHCGECMGCLERAWAYDQLYNEGVTLEQMTKDAVMNYGDIGW
jgi:7-cyano-7-deazaguanine synthase in queuosine biosynthesis